MTEEEPQIDSSMSFAVLMIASSEACAAAARHSDTICVISGLAIMLLRLVAIFPVSFSSNSVCQELVPTAFPVEPRTVLTSDRTGY